MKCTRNREDGSGTEHEAMAGGVPRIHRHGQEVFQTHVAMGDRRDQEARHFRESKY